MNEIPIQITIESIVLHVVIVREPSYSAQATRNHIKSAICFAFIVTCFILFQVLNHLTYSLKSFYFKNFSNTLF